MRILNNARRNLAAGITTVRDLGGWNQLEFSVREAIQRGDFCGPRLILTGKCISGSEAAAAQYPGRYRLIRMQMRARRLANRSAEVPTCSSWA
jgi:imidazolonepropionase-like amidohydrolase